MPSVLSKRRADGHDDQDGASTKYRKCCTVPYHPRWPHSHTLTTRQLALPYLVIPLDDENCIIRVPNFLSPEQLHTYMDSTVAVKRVQHRAAFGRMKPRFEAHYSFHGEPYPPHVLAIGPRVVEMAQRHSPETTFTLGDGVDTHCGAWFPQGGSIGEHADDEKDWGMVAILSMGQCRYLRIRHKNVPPDVTHAAVLKTPSYGTSTRRRHRDLWHIPTTHNSLVIMYGPTFQNKYTHEVPKLPMTVTPHSKWSLKLNFFT